MFGLAAIARLSHTPGDAPPACLEARVPRDCEDHPTDDEPVVVEITESIDLHHFLPSEILDVVDAYLDAAFEAGFREVRLIHGRGKGVQRARIHERLTGDARVDHLEEAPPGRGGWGATLVWLKRS
jgi:dsDNA-specific endonuclease/ATPase MutS2